MANTTISELKEIAASQGHDEEPAKNYQVLPMFLPTDISAKKGTGVIKVVTRQSFMNEGITNWVLYNTFRGLTVVMAAVALMLFPINVYLSALAAIGAGYAFGKFKFKDFIINHQLKQRWLLEGT
ncbi:MAG: hypothetical protein V1708_00600 [Candidatus Micrarchaeota archaeon]